MFAVLLLFFSVSLLNDYYIYTHSEPIKARHNGTPINLILFSVLFSHVIICMWKDWRFTYVRVMFLSLSLALFSRITTNKRDSLGRTSVVCTIAHVNKNISLPCIYI